MADTTFTLNNQPSPLLTSLESTINISQTSQAEVSITLHLYPINATWSPKYIPLTHEHTRIGRYTSLKTTPEQTNGFFDARVLSMRHAEVWAQDGGKVYIKDVKSTNGTFLNGERLSSEGQESEPFELKSDDVVTFGIDVFGDPDNDNRTAIIHHKVSARVVCVFDSDQNAVHVASPGEQDPVPQQQQ